MLPPVSGGECSLCQRFVGRVCPILGRQFAGVGRSASAPGDAHFFPAVGQRRAAIQADDVGAVNVTPGRTPRRDRTSQMLMRAAEHDTEDGFDQCLRPVAPPLGGSATQNASWFIGFQGIS